MNFLRLILYPLVPIYAVIISIRNWFFDKNIFKSKGVDAKIISVGNITIGGSGKTPTVMFLTELLKNEGKKVAVLSRGYGRKSKGYYLVSDGSKMLVTVDVCGDEIYHTASECKIPAAVSENRVEGAENLIKQTNIDTIVLDDAFQHRWIKRDLNLLMFEQSFLTENNLFTNNLLPTGIMREPLSSLKRADAIIVNRKFSNPQQLPGNITGYFKNKKVFTCYYKTIGFVDVKKQHSYNLKEFEGQKSLVVSGIANPYSFINALKKSNVDTQNQLIFRDHKDYTLKDVEQIRKEFYLTNSHSVVTTQKDAVKLIKYSKELDDIDIFYLKIELRMDDTELFRNFILSSINR